MSVGKECWYFAYGSNMLKKQMKERVGYLPESQLAILPGYRLAFNKRSTKIGGMVNANIMPASGRVMRGVIYKCDADAMDRLDDSEWVDDGHYVRHTMTVQTADGQDVSAEVYVAGKGFIEEGKRPRADYLLKITSGASDHGLPADYIEEIKTIAAGRPVG